MSDPTQQQPQPVPVAGVLSPKRARIILTESAKLHAENEALRKRVPADGAIVLTGDDAKAWGEYQKLGKTPAELTKAMADAAKLPQMEGQLADVQRGDALRRQAAADGLDADVLVDFVRDKKLTTEPREVEVTDPKTKAITKRQVLHVVTGEGKDAKAEPFLTWVKREHPKYEPALVAGSGSTSGTSGTSTTGTTAARAPSIPYIPQGPAGPAPQQNPFDEIRARETKLAEERATRAKASTDRGPIAART